MIDFYYWPTPNGWKISIMLEECELEYRMHPVNIGRGEQFSPAFLKLSPNNRMPAIVDHDPLSGTEPVALFESGAILTYLATRTGQFWPKTEHGRMETLQWLFWQVGHIGPTAGQLNHFRNYAKDKIPYAVDRFGDEYNRLLGVMESQLAEREYLAGEYSIADMATWPWTLAYKLFGASLDRFPNVSRWRGAIKGRPAVRRGVDLGKELRREGPPDEEARKQLFGQRAR